MTKIFLNRHTSGLPDHECQIIIKKDSEYLCEWKPFNKDEYTDTDMPGEGYLGTARIIEGEHKDTGLNAWAQNDSEFVWYTYPQLT